MSNIQYNQQQNTFSNVALVLATGFVAHLCPAYQNTADTGSLAQPIYYSTANPATYTQTANVMTGNFTSPPNTFENIISDFYTTFLSKQEYLDLDFETLLNDNLWELYES
ncbi:MAG: hypothetical protein RLZ75_1125 [Pseudomonadota bacterium]|jgi:hypothetical protein